MPGHLAHAELYSIPEKGGTAIVFAPLHGVALRLTPHQVNLLVRVRSGQAGAEDLESPLVRAMVEAGLDEPPTCQPSSPCPASPRGYSPARLTLLLTTACNLRCIYCYADGGHRAATMPVALGQAAIDELFRHAEESGRTRVDVGFHGGGEPTCAWEELTALVGHARDRAASTGIECGLGLATNGCLPANRAEWVAAHFNNVNLSLDGPPRIQDRQRPRADGGRSSPALRRTMRALEKAGCRYACQATVTAATVASMPTVVDYVARHTRAKEIKFEPVMPDGRFRGCDESVPDAETFADSFAAAHALGLERGVSVVFSALRLFGPPLSCFCGAFDTPFNVTPDGFVSACYETFLGTSENRDTFLIGRFDPNRPGFDIDMDRLERLRQRHLANLPSCASCFCRYSCAGDCASRNFHHFGRQDLFAVGARCELIRAVVRGHLQRMLDASDQGQAVRLRVGDCNHG